MQQAELALPSRYVPAPEPAPAAFNYATLKPVDADRLRECATQIRTYQKKVGQQIIAIGDILLAVKKGLDHGQFGLWLGAEFGWSERTAQNYMRASEAFSDKSETVADLPPTTLYRLASPSTPEPVRVAVVERLEKGERLAPDAINTMVSDAKAAEKREREISKLSPRQQKHIRRDDAERAKRREEWERQQAREEVARRDLVDMVVKRFGDDLHEFERLLKACGHWGTFQLQEDIRAATSATNTQAAPAP